MTYAIYFCLCVACQYLVGLVFSRYSLVLINTDMTINERELRKAAVEWMLEQADSYTHAVTLTLKQTRTVLTERGHVREQLTKYSAKAAMRHFINRLNAALYGNAAKRYGKSIAIVAVLEGESTGKLLHYHCAIRNLPERVNDKAIEGCIRAAWKQTNFGNEQVCVTRIHTTGWISYIGKEIGRDECDVLDWENVRK